MEMVVQSTSENVQISDVYCTSIYFSLNFKFYFVSAVTHDCLLWEDHQLFETERSQVREGALPSILPGRSEDFTSVGMPKIVTRVRKEFYQGKAKISGWSRGW